MTSQEQGQQHVQEDVAIGGKEEKRSRQGKGAGPKKMKKKKGLSPVARHHVVAAMLSRSLAVRASPTARQTSPAARRTSPKATPPTAAVLESYRTPTFIDNELVDQIQPPGQDHSQMVTTDDIFDDWDNHLNEHKQDQVITEHDRYLNESPVPRSADFDILKWWSANSVTYPTLAAIARDVLAMPASTVASESAFSMGARTVTDFRSRLSVESVEALICTQDWYRGSASHRRMGAITDLVDLKDTEKLSPLA